MLTYIAIYLVQHMFIWLTSYSSFLWIFYSWPIKLLFETPENIYCSKIPKIKLVFCSLFVCQPAYVYQGSNDTFRCVIFYIEITNFQWMGEKYFMVNVILEKSWLFSVNSINCIYLSLSFLCTLLSDLSWAPLSIQLNLFRVFLYLFEED